MSEVRSFVESTCWRGDQFLSVRKQVVFRVRSTRWFKPSAVVAGIPIQNARVEIDTELVADYGVWYETDNEYLRASLQEQMEIQLDWGAYVYHTKLDHSGIDVIDPETDRVVMKIQVRRYTGKSLSGQELSGRENVVDMTEFKRKRDETIVQDPESFA